MAAPAGAAIFFLPSVIPISRNWTSLRGIPQRYPRPKALFKANSRKLTLRNRGNGWGTDALNWRSAKDRGEIATLGFGYFAFASLSLFLLDLGGTLSGIWLANAFAVAFVLVRPIALPTALGTVALSNIAANVLFSDLSFASALFAVLNVIELAIVAVAGRWWLRDRDGTIETPRQYLVFFAAVLGAGPLLGAAIAGPILHLALGWPALEAAHYWFGFAALGYVLIIPPVVLGVTCGFRTPFTRSYAAAFLATLLGAALLTVNVFDSYGFPFFAIGTYLLATTTVLNRLEVAITATVAGVAALMLAVSGSIPGLETGAAGFANRFQITLALTLATPLFISILLWRSQWHQLRLAESEELFRRAMEDSAVGMAIVEIDGRIRKANGRLAEMLGYEPGELLGKTFHSLTYREDRHIGFKLTKELLAGREESFRFEKRYLRKDGTPVWVQTTGSIIWARGKDQPSYFVCQVEDIDERKKAQQAIVDAENRWSFALSSARQGVWDLDVLTGKTYYSPVWKQMLGYEDDELGDDPDLWMKLIHPEDRQRARQLDEEHKYGQSEFFEAEFRMRHKDGHWIWVLDRGKTIERGTDGRTTRAIGTHTDITSQKLAQVQMAATAAALRAEKEKLRVTLHAIGDAVICTDAASNITFMNQTAEVLTGYKADDAIGRTLSDIYCPRDEENNEVIPVLDEVTSDTAGAYNRAVIERPDGSRAAIRQIVSPIITEGRVSNGSVIVIQDVTDARTLQRQLAYAASHDSLTGLANRASFHTRMRELTEELNGADDDTTHQLLFIDLDRFKAVNDSAGHAAGDAMLKLIAATLRNAVRPTDFAARIGGDEFALILFGCDTECAVREAEKIVAAISEINLDWQGQRFTVGASVGVASIAPGSAAVDEIIANADRGCYAAKSEGRGTVAVHGSQAA